MPCGLHVSGPTAPDIKVTAIGTKGSSSSIGSNDTTPTVSAAKPVIPANFKSDDKFFDSTAVGSGNHQFHRVVQSTDWSRKAQIAGRPEDDLQAYELCFRIE